MKTIGQFIERRRHQLGLSRIEIAKQCNVTRGLVLVWENQSTILPKNFVALARTLKVSIADLEAKNKKRVRGQNCSLTKINR